MDLRVVLFGTPRDTLRIWYYTFVEADMPQNYSEITLIQNIDVPPQKIVIVVPIKFGCEDDLADIDDMVSVIDYFEDFGICGVFSSFSAAKKFVRQHKTQGFHSCVIKVARRLN